MKQVFIVTITTDGMDGEREMRGIEQRIRSFIPPIVVQSVHETKPVHVVWLDPRVWTYNLVSVKGAAKRKPKKAEPLWSLVYGVTMACPRSMNPKARSQKDRCAIVGAHRHATGKDGQLTARVKKGMP